MTLIDNWNKIFHSTQTYVYLTICLNAWYRLLSDFVILLPSHPQLYFPKVILRSWVLPRCWLHLDIRPMVATFAFGTRCFLTGQPESRALTRTRVGVPAWSIRRNIKLSFLVLTLVILLLTVSAGYGWFCYDELMIFQVE